jgi:6-phosphogluconolactonase/glucosamine-6-phosphate isomerase/deaminase
MSGSANGDNADRLERVMLAARLRDGTRRRAEQLVTAEVRASAPEKAFARGAIFLSDSEVVFLFEGAGAADAVRRILDDPATSTVLGSWLPLFDGPLHRVYEAHSWQRG